MLKSPAMGLALLLCFLLFAVANTTSRKPEIFISSMTAISPKNEKSRCLNLQGKTVFYSSAIHAMDKIIFLDNSLALHKFTNSFSVETEQDNKRIKEQHKIGLCLFETAKQVCK